MPNMCAGYPIAKELSWADFWHVRQTDKEGKREAKCNTAKSGDGEKIVIVKTDACEGFYADDARGRSLSQMLTPYLVLQKNNR